MKKNFIIIVSISLLITGGFIYLFFRDHSLLMFSWLRSLNLEQYFKPHNFNKSSILQCICVYSIPNSLWALSAELLIGLVWSKEKVLFLCYSFAFIGVSILFEILQFFSIIPGTFDAIDIIMLLISLELGILIYQIIIKGVIYEK